LIEESRESNGTQQSLIDLWVSKDGYLFEAKFNELYISRELKEEIAPELAEPRRRFLNRRPLKIHARNEFGKEDSLSLSLSLSLDLDLDLEIGHER